jgi:hypothetical protein
MWWSEAMLSAWWVNTTNQIDEASLTLDPPLAKGVAILTLSQNQTDITSLDFFDVNFNFIGLKQQYGYMDHGQTHSIGTYLAQYNRKPYKLYDPNPMIWSQVDSLAKSMYSAIVTDLGQVQVPSKSNIVKNAKTLQLFTSTFAKINEDSIAYYQQLSLQDYDTRQQGDNPTGPLEIVPSTISTKYLCQVPKRKPLGDIFIAVLLADLVLLQAAWKLYTFGVDQIMLRRRPSGKWCEGCIDNNNESFSGRERAKASTIPRPPIKGKRVSPTVTEIESASRRSSVSHDAGASPEAPYLLRKIYQPLKTKREVESRYRS